MTVTQFDAFLSSWAGRFVLSTLGLAFSVIVVGIAMLRFFLDIAVHPQPRGPGA